MKLIILVALIGVAFGIPRPSLPGERIIGGNDTEIYKHPYQLALLSNSQYLCGGVIVSEYWGLTAAHCFNFGIPFNLEVRGGSTYRSSGGQLIYVDEVLRHPKYNSDTLDYDAALMRFSDRFSVSNTRQARMPELNHPIIVRETATISGWGALKEGGGPTEVLQSVEVPIVSDDHCKNVYGIRFTEAMFCTGYLGQGGKDACQEDSGGPVVVDGILVGLVSWAVGCGEPAYPGVNTRVPLISTWILEIIERPSLH